MSILGRVPVKNCVKQKHAKSAPRKGQTWRNPSSSWNKHFPTLEPLKYFIQPNCFWGFFFGGANGVFLRFLLEQPKKNHFIWVKASPKFFRTRFFWNLHVPPWIHHTCHGCFVLPSILVAGRRPPHVCFLLKNITDRQSDVFNPFDNQSSNWIISRSNGEHIWNQPIFLLGGQKSKVIGPTRRALEAARNSETSSKCFIALREATPLI